MSLRSANASLTEPVTPRTAFVFAGGGSLAAAQVGMLRALMDTSCRPDFVVGTSAGALNAFGLAVDPTAAGVEALAHAWSGIVATQVFPRSRLHGLLALLGRRPSLVDPRPLEHLLSLRLPAARLESARLPCYIVCTDMLSGAEVTLHTGSALDAVMASTAIPVIFPPRVGHGRHLIDGGVVSNAPVTRAVQLGATRVIVLPTGFPCAQRVRPEGVVASLMHAFALMVARQLGADVPYARLHAQVYIVPPLCPLYVSPHDFSQTTSLIRSAELQTRSWIDGGGLERAEMPEALLPHVHSADGMRVPVHA